MFCSSIVFAYQYIFGEGHWDKGGRLKLLLLKIYSLYIILSAQQRANKVCLWMAGFQQHNTSRKYKLNCIAPLNILVFSIQHGLKNVWTPKIARKEKECALTDHI
jgi:hypothetical protein